MKRSSMSSKLTTALLIAGSLVLAGCSNTANTSDTRALAKTEVTKKTKARAIPAHVNKTGEVILLRGLANIYSRGMDTIGDRLVKRGVDARVYNHSAWESLAVDIVERSKRKAVSYPVVIMGHSLGGNASVQMATYLGKRGVPVSYVVAFDPTVTTYAGPKVKRVVNYYLPNGRNIVRKGEGFKGKLANVNMSKDPNITHTTIEKNRKLQNRAIGTVMKLVKKRRRRG